MPKPSCAPRSNTRSSVRRCGWRSNSRVLPSRSSGRSAASEPRKRPARVWKLSSPLAVAASPGGIISASCSAPRSAWMATSSSSTLSSFASAWGFSFASASPESVSRTDMYSVRRSRCGSWTRAHSPSRPAASSRWVDDVQRRLLVADEQHALAAREVVADHVGDRLALAGARRSVEHQAGLTPGGLHREGLRGVGERDEALAADRGGFGYFGATVRGLGQQVVKAGGRGEEGVGRGCRLRRFPRPRSSRGCRGAGPGCPRGRGPAQRR